MKVKSGSEWASLSSRYKRHLLGRYEGECKNQKWDQPAKIKIAEIIFFHRSQVYLGSHLYVTVVHFCSSLNITTSVLLVQCSIEMRCDQLRSTLVLFNTL